MKFQTQLRYLQKFTLMKVLPNSSFLRAALHAKQLMQIVRANIWGKQVLHYQELKKLMSEKNEAKIIDLEQTVEIKSSELDKIRVKGGNSLNGNKSKICL